MAETMTCPMCGGQHPAGTTFCPVQLAPIVADAPQSDEGAALIDAACESADEPQDGLSADAFSPSASVGQSDCAPCPVCGYPRACVGDCPQCGHSDNACIPCGTVREASSVVLRFPSNAVVELLPGESIAIGRESEHEIVRAALTCCETVSRRHCRVTVGQDGRTVTVRDLDSTNGTRIGSCLIERGGSRAELVPFCLGLGKSVTVSIERNA